MTAVLDDTTPVVAEPLLRVEHLSVVFRRRGPAVHAVSDVSLDVARGETLGLVGESGCGKSSLSRAIVQLPPPSDGSVWFEGQDLTQLDRENLRRVRPSMQMIFQDPISSLNPRRTIAESVAEPLHVWNSGDRHARVQRVQEMFDVVGLDYRRMHDRKPRELSGGQCQRVSIARAMILGPKLLICDEPVSALDVSVQAQVLNLIRATKARFGLSVMFISHDMAVVKNISDRVAVMYLGKVCEVAPATDLFAQPLHPYTRALVNAVPDPYAERPHVPEDRLIHGDLPSPTAPPSGCRFRTRCAFATERCAREEPALREITAGRFAACHYADEPAVLTTLMNGPAAGHLPNANDDGLGG